MSIIHTIPTAAIGNNAFRGCSSLAIVSIPASVTTIGNNAFAYCYSLTTASYWGTLEPTAASNAFSGTALFYVSVPEGYPSSTFCGKATKNNLTPPAEPTTYTVAVSASPAAGGIVTGGGTYKENTSATVTATANENYTFVNWTENGEVVTTDASFSFEAEADRNLVANFESLPAVPAITGVIVKLNGEVQPEGEIVVKTGDTLTFVFQGKHFDALPNTATKSPLKVSYCNYTKTLYKSCRLLY